MKQIHKNIILSAGLLFASAGADGSDGCGED